jgi:hypothetical protein
MLYGSPVLEVFKFNKHTIGTFSWLQGNIYPSFGLMSIRPNDQIKYLEDSPSFTLDICSLPPQLLIYTWYILLAVITFVVNAIMLYRQHIPTMVGSTWIESYLAMYCSKTYYMLMYLMCFYCLLITMSWFGYL